LATIWILLLLLVL